MQERNVVRKKMCMGSVVGSKRVRIFELKQLPDENGGSGASV